MDFTRLRSLGSLFSMLHQACRNVALYNNNHPDFPMPIDQLEKYMQVRLELMRDRSPAVSDLCYSTLVLCCTEISHLCSPVVLFG